jgi:hypothetical protein
MLLVMCAAGASAQQGAVFAQMGGSCTVPTGTFGGQLRHNVPNAYEDYVGVTLKIISVVPAEAELTIASTKLCGGSFKSMKGICKGNVLRVLLDRSSATTDDCKSPIGLHVRVENGKLVGRYGSAIRDGVDNLTF